MNSKTINRFSVVSIFLLVVLLVCSCSIDLTKFLENESDPEIPVEPDRVKKQYKIGFTLARYSGEKLDPYTSVNRSNRDILSLCYDGLIALDPGLSPVCVVAEYYEINGNTVQFWLSENAVFSDGSRVTAADCSYSFTVASRADSVFNDRFNTITGWRSVSEYVFSVSFSSDSVYNVNLLDIPIIKSGTYDSGFVPVGSGLYKIVRENNTVFLESDRAYISPVNILDVSDSESIVYNFNYGNIHAVFSSVTDDSFVLKNTSEFCLFDTNDFVFLCPNGDREFASFSFYKGVTYAINRQYLSESVLGSKTDSIWFPFNPGWIETVRSELSSGIYDTLYANECFQDGKITVKNGYRVFKGKRISLTILVNLESRLKVQVAESIAADLDAMGFNVTVNKLKWSDFSAAVSEGNYDFYVGEVQVPSNMDLRSVISAAQVRFPGEKGNSIPAELEEAFSDFYSGSIDMRSFLGVFQNNLPLIPLYYEKGALVVSRSVTGEFSPSVSSLFGGMEDWNIE